MRRLESCHTNPQRQQGSSVKISRSIAYAVDRYFEQRQSRCHVSSLKKFGYA